ncbi:MAG: hypothetical protein ACYDDD_03005 [Acidithiobacillus ferrivorans]
MNALQPAQKYRQFVHRLLVVAVLITQLAAILAIQVFRLQIGHHKSIRNTIALRQRHPGNIAYAPADHLRIADPLARAVIDTHLNIVTASEINP